MEQGAKVVFFLSLFFGSVFTFAHERRQFECVVEADGSGLKVILFAANDTSFPLEAKQTFQTQVKVGDSLVSLRVRPFRCAPYTYCRVATFDLDHRSSAKECVEYVEALPALIFEAKATVQSGAETVALKFSNWKGGDRTVSKVNLRFFDLEGRLTNESQVTLPNWEIPMSSVIVREINAPEGTPRSSRFCALEILQ